MDNVYCSDCTMLEIRDLHVEIGEKEVLHDVNLTIGDGETHVLMGPNGSGKSTLLMTLMGFANYTVTNGTITYNGEDITKLPIHKRAQRGMGIMFQRPPTISGLKLGKLLAATYGDRPDEIREMARNLNMDRFLDRDI